jgi:hypothetical protein
MAIENDFKVEFAVQDDVPDAAPLLVTIHINGVPMHLEGFEVEVTEFVGGVRVLAAVSEAWEAELDYVCERCSGGLPQLYHYEGKTYVLIATPHGD